ncbi:hypothetical protein RHMOL_Rhmol13G0206000 [Rhododendron molle]|uniref:Uncharacterized protein n=2 Tax=Rhododendron molle TaxID=49168 RepID=A0ACC0LA80_RHOML|nr:hypothetical protein RHMOL_Rhmol13G0206000 [Rhododendron molle]KAI8525144.1 hypothetical protein RHMOL_Rhmol13G0206000 [Rhododendron molle]
MRPHRSETRKRRTMIKWESLNSDLLLHIFLRLEPLFLLSTVAFVCRPWGRLCFSRFLTKDGEKTLDLGGLKGDRSGLLFPTGPYGRIGTAGLMKLIRAVMDVYSCDDYDRVDDGDGTRVTPFTKMVFPFGPFVWTDAHLVYVAERSPDLRELTLPCGSEITHKGFSRALRYWNEIEKMSIGPFRNNYDVYRIIEAAGIICKKLEVLSLSGFFVNMQLSPQIAQNLKGVKLLRLEKAYIGKVALKNILSKCKKLQKVEIWHCLTLEGNESDLLASCEIKKTEVDGVIKWSLVGDAEPHNLKNLLNLLWEGSN